MGGGEMGALMRSIDWSSTRVGPVSSWPQSLRTALSILLEAKFPMYIAWGSGFTQFYNDAYRPMLGSTKHPSAMGGSSRETFAEIWDIIGPMFAGVMRGRAVGFNDFMFAVNRHGFLEECYFVFSYSPIRDESGGVGGVLVTVHETTARVLSERRLRTVRDLAAKTASASTAAVWQRAAQVLATDPGDLGFCLFYKLQGEEAHRCSEIHNGLAPAAPAVIALDDPQSLWPLREALASGEPQLVEDVQQRLGVVYGAMRTEPIRCAMVLPLGRPGSGRPHGFLIVGLSPRLPIDDDYLGFLHLAADQIAAALSNAQAHEEERRRTEALAELDRAKTAFFSNVSHELRTPLTLLLCPTEEALASPGQALAGENLQIVRRNALRLLKLVNMLLDFSRIEAGRATASYRRVDLSALTSDLASTFRSAIERAGLRLEVDCPPLTEQVYVDQDHWEKIVLNLISNAFKFTFSGVIRVALRGYGDRVELVVSDTGIGVAAAELPHMFERFHRIRSARARTHEGSGIGLALVHELVQLQGGTIRVSSQVDQGTTFTITLPTGVAHLPADQIDATPLLSSTALGAAPFVEEAMRWLPDNPLDERTPLPVPASVRPGLMHDQHANARILIVDDNADMRDYLRRLLGTHFQVEVACDGMAAIEACRRRRPSLIISDVMMPRLDGFGLLRELRADGSLRAIPVIMLSARVGEEALLDGLRSGVEDYMVKPFSPRELIARVDANLEFSRLRSEAEQARSRLFSQLMQAPVPISVSLGPELVYELANPMYEQMVRRGSLVGKSFVEAFPEVKDGAVVQLLKGVYQTGVPFEAEEYRVPAVEGAHSDEDRYYKFRVQPMRDERDQVVGIMTVGVEVTEQVRARRQVERARALLEAVVQQMPAGVLIAEAPTGRLLFANQRVKDILGYPPIETKTVADFAKYTALHPDGSSYAPQEYCMVRALNGQSTMDEELLLKRGDGQLRILSVSAAPVRDPQGQIIAAVTAFADITERRQAEQQRDHLLVREREARGEAEVANRSKDEFLALLGHELRNPLSPILTALELMRMRGGDSLQRERTILERQVNHLVRLVDDLLDISRITRGKIELVRERVEIADVVNKGLEMASPLIERRRHLLRVAVARPGLAVEGDPVRLAQVISNLLTNAAKYTEPQGRISVTASRINSPEGAVIELVVRDSGIGLRSEILPHIFDPFFQERQALDRAQGGLGLGLSIVRSLVQLHGGTVMARSEGLGKGSEFIVRLPAAPGAEAVAPRMTSDPILSPAQVISSARVLVVDDNNDAAALLVEALRALGYNARAAADGPSALTLAQSFRPDVVLLDIGLPIMDGYELARHLRQIEGLGAVRLVAVTGYGQKKDRARSEAAGIDLHLVKPIRLEQITEFMARALGRRPSTPS